MINQSKSILVLGIDPSIATIPNIYTEKELNLEDWGTALIETCSPYIVGIKIQSAYFENLGLKGLVAMVHLIKYARKKGLVVIMDAKRGDIGSTSLAYANAYLSNINNGGNNDFESDFLTVNPLMGEDCLEPFIKVSWSNNKGIFVLLETSNKGVSMILKETDENGRQMNEKISQYIQDQHDAMGIDNGSFGPIGCVIGATNRNVSHWREKLPNSIFLMPGIGAQGGSWESVKSCLNQSNEGVMVPISRGITKAKSLEVSEANYIQEVKRNIQLYYDQMGKVLN